MSQLLKPRWIFASVVVIAAVFVMIRLGLWQLDRLEQRRALNARVQAQLDQPPLDLNAALVQSGSETAARMLPEMEYRMAMVRGTYDYSQEVVLRNQAWNNQFGVHLLTPLQVEGTGQYILVDRGWVPYEDFETGNLHQYQIEGPVVVRGFIQRSRTQAAIGRQEDPPYKAGEERLAAFFAPNLERLAAQTPYALLPVYVLEQSQDGQAGPPYPEELNLNLTEGSHLGYAIQWFTFAAILAVGYPFYLKHELHTPAELDRKIKAE